MSLAKRRLAWMQPLQVQANERYVHNFEEFVQAIGDYAVAPVSTVGRKIVFKEQIIATTPITLTTGLTGLIIDGNGFRYVNGSGATMNAFNLEVGLLRFKNIDVTKTTGFSNWATGWACSGTLASNEFYIQGSLFTGANMVTCAINNSFSMIEGCIVSHSGTGISVTNALNWRIANNLFFGASTLISLGAVSTKCSISGNSAFAAGGCNSNASAGLNAWAGNANFGALTPGANLAASDVAAGNT